MGKVGKKIDTENILISNLKCSFTSEPQHTKWKTGILQGGKKKNSSI